MYVSVLSVKMVVFCYETFRISILFSVPSYTDLPILNFRSFIKLQMLKSCSYSPVILLLMPSSPNWNSSDGLVSFCEFTRKVVVYNWKYISRASLLYRAIA